MEIITEEEYAEAQRIINEYQAQLKEKREAEDIKRKEAQLKRESECKEHYYLDDGKWTSTMSCQFCGKQIN